MRMSFDLAAEFYDRTRGPPKHIMKQLVETMKSELQGIDIVLDIGVGTGRFAKPLQEGGFNVVGIDISKKMLEKAIAKKVDSLILGDACDLPFREGRFDAALCVHVLHLISEWKQALLEICRVTTKVMLSMEYGRKDPIREVYKNLLRELGYEERRLGRGEWELKSFVKARSKLVASYDVSADERLDHLGQRAYSSQWRIPEEVNKQAVDELKRQFGGKKLPQELHVLVWNINDLKAYCEASGSPRAS